MNTDTKAREDDLSARLMRAAAEERPAFDEARHARILRAVHGGAAPVNRPRVLALRWPTWAAAAAVLAAALTIGLLALNGGDATSPATTPAGLLHTTVAAVLEVDGDTIPAEQVGTGAVDMVRQWATLEQDAEVALELLDRFAVRLALASDH